MAQIKTIEKIIRSKMLEWLESITDVSLRLRVKSQLLVSGGSICSLLLKEEVNDYDVYIQDRQVLMDLTKYYVGKLPIEILDGNERDDLISKFDDFKKFNGYYISLKNLRRNQVKLYVTNGTGCYKVENEKNKDYDAVFFSPNAISLSNDVQIVLRFWGDHTEIHKTFDFIHATNYFTMEDGLVRNLEAIESILTKQLRYQGSFYPLTSIIRMKKFLKRGFNINAGEILKILFQVSKLDLENPDVLEEQLIGVDVAYFEILINNLRQLQEDPSFVMNETILFKLIDKVFNDSNEDI